MRNTNKKQKILLSAIAWLIAFSMIFESTGLLGVTAVKVMASTFQAGQYDISATLLQVGNDGASMADGALQSAQVDVQEDEMTLHLNMGSLMGTYLEEVTYPGGTAIITETDENGNAMQFSMPITHGESNFLIGFSFTALGNPMTQQARLVLDWDGANIPGVEEESDEGEEEEEPEDEEPEDEEPEDEITLGENQYLIDAEFWHATNETLSSANGSLKSAIVEVQGDELILYLNMDAEGTGYVLTMEHDGAALAITDTDNDRPVQFSMPVTYGATELVVTFKVQGMPAHIPGVSARLMLDWDGLELVTGDQGNNGNEGNNGDEGDNGNEGNNGDEGNNGNEGNNDENKDNESKSLENGKYKIGATIKNASSDADSMANTALQSAELEVINNDITVFLNMSDIDGTYVQKMTYEAADESMKDAVISKTDNGNAVQFAMPIAEGQVELPVTFSFDITATARSLQTQPARLVLDWNDVMRLTNTGNNDNNNNDDNNNSDNNNNNNNNNSNNNDDNKNDNNDELDKNNLKDGIYEIEVDLWHATDNKASMASDSVVKLARIAVEKGKSTMYLYTKSMTFGNITASLQYLQVEKSSGGYAQAKVATKNAAGDPTSFTFALPHTNEYIAVKVNPEVAIMGNDYIDARLKLNWKSLAAVSDNTNLNNAPNDSNVSGGAGTTGTGNTGNSGTSSGAKTGDTTSNIWIWLLAGSVLTILALQQKKKKERG